MNNVTITDYYDKPGVWEMEIILTRTQERNWKETVFPFLFDGQTTGSRTRITKGRIRYRLLIYLETIVNTFKQLLVNAILADNGQFN